MPQIEKGPRRISPSSICRIGEIILSLRVVEIILNLKK